MKTIKMNGNLEFFGNDATETDKNEFKTFVFDNFGVNIEFVEYKNPALYDDGEIDAGNFYFEQFYNN